MQMFCTLALLLPLVVLGSSAPDPCQSIKSVLHCRDIPLEEISLHYDGEVMLRLDNVTGVTAWNASGLDAVNTIIGNKVRLNQAGLKDLLSLPHLSTLELKDSAVDILNASTIFLSNKLRTLRLIGSLIRPVDFFNFTLLSEFDLSGNKLLSVPKIQGDKIAYLNLSTTHIRIVENLETLPFLEELDLSNNGLRTVKKDAFAFNFELEKLWLQNNDLQTISFNASKLKILNLNWNSINILTDIFAGVPSLTNLQMIGNRMMELVDPFKSLPHLKTVDLSDNELSMIDPKWLENTLELEVLRMSHNQLLDLPVLTNLLHGLHHLNLSRNSLQALNGGFFKQTPMLAILDVSNNQLKSIDDAAQFLRNVNKLYASHNFLTITNKTFAKSDMLNFANLSHNHLTVGAGVFEKAPVLRDIDLSYNEIEDFCVGAKGPSHIKNLDITFNKLKSISCLTNLDSMYVEGNPLGCDLSTPPTPRPSQRTINTPSDLVRGNSTAPPLDVQPGESEDGDWEDVYNKLCPQTVTSQAPPASLTKQATSEVPIIHDIMDESISHDDDKDEDEDDEEDSTDEDYSDEPETAEVDNKIDIQYNQIHFIPAASGPYEPLATWAFALLGVCLVLLLINLLMFVWYKRRERQVARLGSDRPYEQLNNEVYKNTTQRLEGVHRPVDLGRYFTSFKTDKLNHMIVKLGLKNNQSSDAESQARMIPTNQIA